MQADQVAAAGVLQGHGAFGQRGFGDRFAAEGADVEDRAEHADPECGRGDDEGLSGIVRDVEIGLAVEFDIAAVDAERIVVGERRTGAEPDVGAVGHGHVHGHGIGVVETMDERCGGDPVGHESRGERHGDDCRRCKAAQRNTTAPAERSVGAESVDPPVEAVERTHETGLQLRIGTLHAAALPDGAQLGKGTAVVIAAANPRQQRLLLLSSRGAGEVGNEQLLVETGGRVVLFHGSEYWVSTLNTPRRGKSPMQK